MKQTIYRKRILMLVLLLGIAVSAISVHAADSIRGPQISDEGIIFWDCIYFGSYYQSDSSAKEPILWRVLSVNGNDAFLLADQNLDCQPYHTQKDAVTWEHSALRAWLNSSFYNSAFNNTEKNAIRATTVINNDYNGTDGGNDTQDKVYLLSIEEVRNSLYGFSYNSCREAKNTPYAKQQGADTYHHNEDSRIVWALNVHSSSSYNGNGDWWLRTPGKSSVNAPYVCYDGNVWTTEYANADIDDNAVRPCLHIDLGRPGWSYAGTITSGGTFTCAEHTWSTGEITIEPTYESEGELYYYCTVCDAEKSEVIPKLTKASEEKTNSDDQTEAKDGKTDTGTAADQNASDGQTAAKDGKTDTGTASDQAGSDGQSAAKDEKPDTKTSADQSASDAQTAAPASDGHSAAKDTKTAAADNTGSKKTGKKVSKITVGNGIYKLSGTSAALAAPKKKTITSLSVPASVKANGRTYKVTAISANAFKGMKKLTTVTIGKNVKKIGKNAFSGSSKLKKITIKTTKLTAGTVGANAFKGINKKAVIKCPKAKKAAYKKLLLAKGMKKSMAFK